MRTKDTDAHDWVNAHVRVAVKGDAHEANRRRVRESRDELREAVSEAVRVGVPEAEVARLAKVTRMTIRAWTGKGK